MDATFYKINDLATDDAIDKGVLGIDNEHITNEFNELGSITQDEAP